MKRPVVFFHVPKTGGVSLIAMAKNQEPPLLFVEGHHTIKTMRTQMAAGHFDSAFRFGFVRNPFDRFVSAYYYLRYMKEDNPYWKDDCDKKKTLEQFGDFAEFCAGFEKVPEIATYHFFRPMVYWVCENGQSVLHFTGRFESFEEDVRRLAPLIGLRGTLEKRNTSQHRSWQKYYEQGHCVDLVLPITNNVRNSLNFFLIYQTNQSVTTHFSLIFFGLELFFKLLKSKVY